MFQSIDPLTDPGERNNVDFKMQRRWRRDKWDNGNKSDGSVSVTMDTCRGGHAGQEGSDPKCFSLLPDLLLPMVLAFV